MYVSASARMEELRVSRMAMASSAEASSVVALMMSSLKPIHLCVGELVGRRGREGYRGGWKGGSVVALVMSRMKLIHLYVRRKRRKEDEEEWHGWGRGEVRTTRGWEEGAGGR